jgi:hypothetical protein
MVAKLKEREVEREARTVLAPVGVKCRLCQLDPTLGDGRSAVVLDVDYGVKGMSNRRSWVCADCIAVLEKVP